MYANWYVIKYFKSLRAANNACLYRYIKISRQLTTKIIY